jgi:ATP-dependent Clp protease ATP-binding subunit ClpC
VVNRLKEIDVNIEYTEAVKSYLAKTGFDITYGARPLRRAITKTIEDKLSEEMLKGNIIKGQLVTMDVEDNKIVFKTKSLL